MTRVRTTVAAATVIEDVAGLAMILPEEEEDMEAVVDTAVEEIETVVETTEREMIAVSTIATPSSSAQRTNNVVDVTATNRHALTTCTTSIRLGINTERISLSSTVKLPVW